MKQLVKSLLATAFLVAVAPDANAKVFRNAYVSFELPEKWNCTLEQTEWVCRTTDPGLAEAIIILTAKEVGPQDALSGYEGFLKSPRAILTRSGQSLQSTVYKVEQRKINNHAWVDGMHFASEVQNYYTRYVATTKDKIAVLVTFSAHRLHYAKYSGDFLRAVDSLQVVATRALMNSRGDSGAGGYADTLSQNTGDFPMEPGGDSGGAGIGSGSAAQNFLAIALIIGGIGAYLLIKNKQKGKKKRRR